ncbi:ankyrin unc44 [Colletotrichum karsti]|uniref:Ankyrin unc44 n=1 Tax=Colletotrichum karsti TaxID=1095194 RepID=A0A9P6HY53_9PEZI|nr:ankyrin unc44 [Colletotrichum karsti]KAF9872988.1 ankyrin unc44 [Colletotrichum karsti]
MVSRQGSWPLSARSRPSVAAVANSDEAHDAQKALSFWVSEARKLPEDQRAFFLDGNQAESYSDYVEVLKNAVQQKADTSLVMRFSKKLLPIYHLANSIAPIATSASQLNPMPASLVLGGITCILSLTVSFDQYQNKILETLEYMVDAVNNVNLYRDKKMFDSDAGVKTCEIRLATDILEFGVTVARMFYNKEGKGKNSLRTALKMQGNPFEAHLLDIKTNFEAHLRSLEAQRQLVRSDWAKSTNEGVAQLLESGYREKEKATEAEALRRNKEDDKERQKQQRQFLEWLPSIDFSGPQEDHFERRVDGSGSWLVEHETFKSWRESLPSTLLWVYGKPGSGKSHLAAKAIDELSQDPSRTSSSALAYVYCSSISSRKGIDFSGILASILAQLCRQLPLTEDLGHLISRQDYGEGSGPTRREMRNGIAQALSKFQTSYIVIDGLDECHGWEDDHFKEFCGFILELTTPLSRSTKILVLSRPSYAEIDRIVAGFPRIQVDDGANLPDLEHYISQKVEEVLRDPSEDERIEFQGIKEQLLKNSTGTFLWPDRKLSHLKEIGSIEDMSNAMENATEGLDDLYRQDIQRILAKPSRFIRERAMNALLWITNSRRPLFKAELIEALSVKRGRRGLTVRQRLSSSIPLCTECADLIFEKDGTFHLYHPSLKDFLVAEYQTIPGYDALQRNADERIAEVCLTYLNFDIFGSTYVNSEKELKSVMKGFPLLQYASRNWGHHFSIASENRDDGILIQQLLQTFLRTEAAMSLSLQVIFRRISFPYLSQPPGAPTALHIFAAHNLTDLAKSLTDSEHLIACPDRALLCPIHYATFRENKEMAMWLLHCYDAHFERNKLIRHLLRDDEFSFLHMFATRDWDEGISLLLSFGCDCRVADNHASTPLHYAAFFGATSAAEVLLNAGADPTALDDSGDTPLNRAVSSKNVEIVMEIFKHDDGKNISKCLRSVTLAAHWIGAVLSVYRQFAFDPSLQGETFLDYLPVYTREFVLLLETIKKFRWSPADELSSLEQEKQGTAIEAIVRGLNEVYDGFRPNYNPAPFFYHGHRYIRIDNERSKAEASKYLDDNKELRPSFYEDVIAYYANLESNEIDDLIEDDPLPVCSNRQEGDNDRMWESIRSLHFGLATEAFPRFLDKTIRDNWVDESLEQLRETLEPLYYKREALGENTAQVRIVDKEIEVYEVAWKMVHAMLDIPFERTVWEEKQYQQEKWSNARRMAASEEVMSDDGSEDSWHTANDAALDEEDSDSACRIGEAES